MSQLAIEDLTVTYASSQRRVEALRDVSLTVRAGETLGVVGESGSGKSTLGLAIMRLLPDGSEVRGRIKIDDDDLLRYSEEQMQKVRGATVGIVFQDSLSALNPVFTIESQLVETLRRHDPALSRNQAQQRAGDTLEELQIPRDRLKAYPHQFSGGMRQRAMIAAALAPDPAFLIADESTSDLDTVSQRRILDLLLEVQRTRGLGLILVSHDLGVIQHVCAHVAVLYRGDLVEYGPTSQVLQSPEHEYTQGLVRVSAKARDEHGRLYTLPKRWESEARDGAVT